MKKSKRYRHSKKKDSINMIVDRGYRSQKCLFRNDSPTKKSWIPRNLSKRIRLQNKKYSKRESTKNKSIKYGGMEISSSEPIYKPTCSENGFALNDEGIRLFNNYHRACPRYNSHDYHEPQLHPVTGKCRAGCEYPMTESVAFECAQLYGKCQGLREVFRDNCVLETAKDKGHDEQIRLQARHSRQCRGKSGKYQEYNSEEFKKIMDEEKKETDERMRSLVAEAEEEKQKYKSEKLIGIEYQYEYIKQLKNKFREKPSMSWVNDLDVETLTNNYRNRDLIEYLLNQIDDINSGSGPEWNEVIFLYCALYGKHPDEIPSNTTIDMLWADIYATHIGKQHKEKKKKREVEMEQEKERKQIEELEKKEALEKQRAAMESKNEQRLEDSEKKKKDRVNKEKTAAIDLLNEHWEERGNGTKKRDKKFIKAIDTLKKTIKTIDNKMDTVHGTEHDKLKVEKNKLESILCKAEQLYE